MSDRSTRTGPSRETWCLMTLGLAFLVQVFVLYRPQLAYFTHFPLAVPDPFTDVPRVKRGALLLIFGAGVVALTVGVMKRQWLVARPSRALAAIYLFGVALHLAFLGSLAGSPLAMEHRALISGHGEYLTEAVAVADLRATLKNYEPYARGHVYLANKGPGVLVLCRGLDALANAAPIRRWLEPIAPNLLTLRWWLAERGEELPRGQMERLRHLLALILVVYPFVTLLPVFLIGWLGRALVDTTFGLVAAQLYPLVPAVALLVAHLDYVIFPLCAIGIVAPFVVGVETKRPALVAASALVFAVYFSLTLAAASILVMLAAFVGLTAVRRLRRAGGIGSIAWEVMTVAAVFAVTAGLAVMLVAWALPFHPAERYSAAREIQRNWTSAEYGFFWLMANLLGYLLAFGLMQAVLLFLEQGQALRRSLAGRNDAIDDLGLAWLCLVVALEAFGRNHGETNRIWAFLSPMACLFVARYVCDRLSSRRLWIPLVAALAAVVLVRWKLSYF